MPTGIYKRTKQMRKNISLGRMGIEPWNKGVTKYEGLLFRINQLLLDKPLKVGEIYSICSGEITYKKLKWLLSEARAKGIIDKSLIKKNHNRGGAGQPKFKVGDKVRIIRLNKRTPQWLRNETRIDTPRTIVATFKVREDMGYVYYLGSNKIGTNSLDGHRFRANELELWVKREIGRPREKRTYNRNFNVDINTKPNTIYNTTEYTPYMPKTPILASLSKSPSISCVNCICEAQNGKYLRTTIK